MVIILGFHRSNFQRTVTICVASFWEGMLVLVTAKALPTAVLSLPLGTKGREVQTKPPHLHQNQTPPMYIGLLVPAVLQ